MSIVKDAATIGSTEYSIVSDSTTPASSTEEAVVQVWFDVSAMAGGDEFRFRLKEKINAGSQLTVYDVGREGVQGGPIVFPALHLGEGWDITVQKIAGTDRSIGWSMRKLPVV